MPSKKPLGKLSLELVMDKMVKEEKITPSYWRRLFNARTLPRNGKQFAWAVKFLIQKETPEGMLGLENLATLGWSNSQRRVAAIYLVGSSMTHDWMIGGTQESMEAVKNGLTRLRLPPDEMAAVLMHPDCGLIDLAVEPSSPFNSLARFAGPFLWAHPAAAKLATRLSASHDKSLDFLAEVAGPAPTGLVSETFKQALKERKLDFAASLLSRMSGVWPPQLLKDGASLFSRLARYEEGQGLTESSSAKLEALWDSLITGRAAVGMAMPKIKFDDSSAEGLPFFSSLVEQLALSLATRPGAAPKRQTL